MPTLTIASLFRYPVKSMAGETLEQADLTPTGLYGDRAYALVDTETGKVGTAKSVRRFGDLLKASAAFTTQLQPGQSLPHVTISLPSGQSINGAQPAEISAAFGETVSLLATAPPGLLLEFPAGTLGGQHSELTESPISSAAPPGTFFDLASVLILTTSSLRALEAAYPQGQFDLKRFRPNLVIDTGDQPGFIENSWIGRILSIGPSAQLRIMMPCPRCVMTTLPHADLPLDPGILRTIAQLNKINLGEYGDLPCFGVYAEVLQPGPIYCGDAIELQP